MKPFFSIIIPCCDVGPFVRECVESVKTQTFAEWECLIVVETSKDDTEAIVNEIASGDARIRVFTQARSGSAATPRNTGLGHAQGEYVIFLDGDDKLLENSLRCLHARITASPGADLYPCASHNYNDTLNKPEPGFDNFSGIAAKELTGQEATILLGNGNGLLPAPWLSIYRRLFLEEYHLRFVPGLKNEDAEFSPRVLYRAKRVIPLHEVYYCYRIRENSQVTSNHGWRISGLPAVAYSFSSLLDFYAKVKQEPGFDARVEKAWGREWLRKIVFCWFDPFAMRNVPQSMRVQTLDSLFSKGFDTFDQLRQTAAFHRKITSWWVKAFVQYPHLRWSAEMFFKMYFFVVKLWGK